MLCVIHNTHFTIFISNFLFTNWSLVIPARHERIRSQCAECVCEGELKKRGKPEKCNSTMSLILAETSLCDII